MFMDHQFIAQQLRKPSGDFASKIAEKMNTGNKPLYDLTFRTLRLNDGDKLLEIGFGNGIHFNELLSLKKELQLYGIDYSADMVKLATVLNKQHIDSGKIVVTEGNSNQLPYEDQSFDLVFCNMVIYFWENPGDHLNEIHRVLKPGGRFCTGMRTKESMLEFPFTKFGFNLYTVDEWTSLLAKNNFRVMNTIRSIDPEFDDFDKAIQLESVSITAVKQT